MSAFTQISSIGQHDPHVLQVLGNNDSFVNSFEKYPTIMKLLRLNPATLTFLVASGALVVAAMECAISQTFTVPKLDGGVAAWNTVKQSLEDFFMSGVRGDSKFRHAARCGAVFVHQEALRLLPCWPASGSQKCDIPVHRLKGEYTINLVTNELSTSSSDAVQTIHWGAEGKLVATDTCLASEWQTNFSGQAKLVGGHMDKIKLEYYENLFKAAIMQENLVTDAQLKERIDFAIKKNCATSIKLIPF